MGVIEQRPTLVHVLLVGRRCRPKQGVSVHTDSALDRRDIRTRHGLPVTNVARGLIDYAHEACEDELEAAVSEARAQRLLRDGELEAALDRAGVLRGVGAMRALLANEYGGGYTRSKAERLMRRLAKAASLPQSLCNAPPAGWNVDSYWPEHRLVVEVDGYPVHGHRTAFERDRRKGLVLAAAGDTVIRLTWIQLTREPLMVAARLAQALLATARARA